MDFPPCLLVAIFIISHAFGHWFKIHALRLAWRTHVCDAGGGIAVLDCLFSAFCSAFLVANGRDRTALLSSSPRIEVFVGFERLGGGRGVCQGFETDALRVYD